MKVLIAIDDECFGEAIADFVTKQQWPPLTEFRVVHVLEPILLDQGTGIAFLPLLSSTLSEIRQEAAKLVRHIALKIRTAFKTTRVEEIVVEGHAKEEVLDLATRWPADLILVGSHGRRGISQFLMGSVSQAIVQSAPCTVTVVRLPKGAKGNNIKEETAQHKSNKKEEVSV